MLWNLGLRWRHFSVQVGRNWKRLFDVLEWRQAFRKKRWYANEQKRWKSMFDKLEKNFLGLFWNSQLWILSHVLMYNLSVIRRTNYYTFPWRLAMSVQRRTLLSLTVTAADNNCHTELTFNPVWIPWKCQEPYKRQITMWPCQHKC